MTENLGVGLGLRSAFFEEILNGKSRASWFEVISENYMRVPGLAQGHAIKKLLKVRENAPIALHGVSLSIGSVDPLDEQYISSLKELMDLVQPVVVSDHLCWTSLGGYHSHDLLPLPYTEEAIKHVVSNVDMVQSKIGRTMAFENVSSYMTYRQSEMPEWEFIKEIALRSGCGLLVDINNIYVSSVNHRFDAKKYLDNIPWDHVVQIHLGGHFNRGDIIIDTHDNFVCDDVWLLFRYACQKFGTFSTMIEWDANFPEFRKIEQELLKIEKIIGASNVSKRYPEFSI